jgi:Family of unknown function (DUF5754)
MIKIVRASPPKKWTAIFPDGRKVSFGAAGYEDYTMHHDKTRMMRYITRHQKRENWSDPYTAGFWSRWLLWSKPTMKEAIKEAEKHVKQKIRLYT